MGQKLIRANILELGVRMIVIKMLINNVVYMMFIKVKLFFFDFNYKTYKSAIHIFNVKNNKVVGFTDMSMNDLNKSEFDNIRYYGKP